MYLIISSYTIMIRDEKSSMPLVSVVIATFNGDAYLAKQLDSIINQTHDNLEILIQDDCSTDNTLNIARDYSTKDRRITVYQNQKNIGINKNFYEIIGKSKGEYIAISDQDDIWSLRKIEILLNNISTSSLIYTDSELIKDNDEPWGITLLEKLERHPKSGKFMMNLITENTISGHACLFRGDLKHVITSISKAKHQENEYYDQVIATIASFNGGVKYYNEPLTSHRIHKLSNCNYDLLSRNVIKKSAKPDKCNSNVSNKKMPISRKLAKRPTLHTLIQRKRKRIKSKIQAAYRQIVIAEKQLNKYAIDYNKIAGDPKGKFRTIFFNRTFYSALLTRGLVKKDAMKLSLGRLYYIFFKSF